MALFPTAKGGHGGDGEGGPRSEVIYVDEEKWVPVVRLGGKVSISLHWEYRRCVSRNARSSEGLLGARRQTTHVQLCIFPGIPSLFQQLLLGLVPYLPLPPASSKPFRHLIHTGLVKLSLPAPISSAANQNR